MALAVVVLCVSCSSSGTISTDGTSPAARTASTAVDDAAPVPSSGCARTQAGLLTDQRRTVEVDGVTRWYLVSTPSPTAPSPTAVSTASSPKAGATIPRPLVVNFHGLAEGAAIQSTTTMFGQLGQKDGFVSVFPNGTGNPVQWNTSATSNPNPDLEFVTAMLDQLESTVCIDTSRVYATGFSDGSFMVSLVACTMSDRFAAIAAVSGLVDPTPCHPTRRVPVIAFHGTADPILFFNGGVGTATLNRALGRGSPSGSSTTTAPPKVSLHGSGYPANVQAWAVRDGCDPHSTDAKLSSQVILRTYRCPAGTDVEFYIILGGGHAWPGSKFTQSISSLTGYTTFQINATEVIWRFFRRFSL